MVVIYDTNGNEIFREIDNDELSADESLVRIFLSIKGHLEQSAPIEYSGKTEKPFIAEIIEGSITTRLTCHFSFTQGESYCVDGSGQYYKIPNEYSTFFFSSAFAELLYSNATPPTLYTESNQVITPTSADWKYKDIDEIFKTATLISTASEVKTYDMSGGISLLFDNAPDDCTVTVRDGDSLIFTGTLEQLNSIKLDTSTELTISLSAMWNEESQRSYYGTVSYEFKVIIHNRAELSISSNEIGANGFVLIKATNVTDPSRLEIKLADDATSPTPYFIGETAYVAIPYPDGYSESEYNIFVAYGVSAKTFTVKLNDGFVSSQHELSKTLNEVMITSQLMQLSNNSKFSLSTAPSAPETFGFTKSSDLGDSIIIGNTFFESPFVEYSVSGQQGVDIHSSFGGRVCITGDNEYLGRFIAIDCGLGIKVWYFGLSERCVSVDDYVAVGEVIGTTDTLALGVGEGFYMMVSCQDSVIDPKYLFETVI